MKKICMALVLGVGLFVNSAFAGISVVPILVGFKPGDLPRKDITVTNLGKKTAYVKVTPYMLINPGTKKSKEVLERDPSKSGIMVSPNKLIIPANGKRVVRIMLTKPYGDKDRFYTINVSPVEGKLVPTKDEDGKSKDSMSIHIVISYGVLVTVRPKNMHANVKITRKDKEITATNTGNTNALLLHGKQCIKDKCEELPTKRLFAGATWTFTAPKAAPVKFRSKVASETKEVVSN
ncbi:MAG: hypothetical protein COB50_00545 [Thiotrichales bacterium]|nr:MAG: hypothetical protein COB50_00545 [Thiotrichales bacterium]